MSLIVNVHENGSFEILTENLSVRNCYPGVDGYSIRSTEVNIVKNANSNVIKYTTINGLVSLLIYEDNGYIKIKSELSEFKCMPHWFYPIFSADIEGINGIFRQGMGMCGPSGYSSINSLEKKKEKVYSHGIISMKSEECFLYFMANEHKHFINRYEVNFFSEEEIDYRPSQRCYQSFSAGFKLERVCIKETDLPEIFVFCRNALQDGLTEAAEIIAGNMRARTHKESAYHWCSWYYLYHNLSHKILLEYLDSFSRMTPLVPLKYIQIDAGYCESLGDWLKPNSLWTNGLKATFDDISKYGYKPGIWIGPYMVGNRSQLFMEHPDWVLHDMDNKIIPHWKFYNEPKLWNYRDEEIYILDTSHPEAMKYLRNVFHTLHEWGAELFKTDFMFYGIVDSVHVKRYSPGKTSIEYFRELLQAIREEIGEESYWLGCIAPFLPFIGYADGMRIAGDMGAQWKDEGFGPSNMIRELIADNYFNNIYWQNDPDAILLRDFHTFLSEMEIESLALLQAISGGAVYTSDPLHELSEKSKKLFRFIEPSGKTRPDVPYLSEERKEIVLTHKLAKNRYILFFFNPTEKEIVEYYKLIDLIGEEELYIFLWNTQTYEPGSLKNIVVRIPPHGCSLYFASTKEDQIGGVENLWV